MFGILAHKHECQTFFLQVKVVFLYIFGQFLCLCYDFVVIILVLSCLELFLFLDHNLLQEVLKFRLNFFSVSLRIFNFLQHCLNYSFEGIMKLFTFLRKYFFTFSNFYWNQFFPKERFFIKVHETQFYWQGLCQYWEYD